MPDISAALRIDAPRALEAMEQTWPADRRTTLNGWTLRLDPGGGKRVSAATPEGPGGDIAEAEAGMRAAGQIPLFMLRPEDAALDSALCDRGYALIDPVTIYAGAAAELAKAATPKDPAIRCDLPLAMMAEFWARAGIGPARLAVMARAADPRCWLLLRQHHMPAGVGFVSAWKGLAMIHAVEVAPDLRRQGLGQALLAAAAQWALDQGAEALGLAVTDANGPANGLYRKLGMRPVAHYHYRVAPE